jgi:hypothetical protein
MNQIIAQILPYRKCSYQYQELLKRQYPLKDDFLKVNENVL